MKVPIGLRQLLICMIMLISSFGLSGQNSINQSGYVFDSLGNPMEYVNVFAIPKSDMVQLVYSITDEKGKYHLSLTQNEKYTLEISFLGFEKLQDSIVSSIDLVKNYTMNPNSILLNEVTINSYVPMVVKEDTIIYRTAAFVTGEERKLREVLKKLPGIEVDKEGSVRVNGKKVSKLMVEGRPFFYGDTKLGVNNIPARVIDGVEVLDNYSDLPFMKGLNNDGKMAMNIKLKAENKNFAFGEIESGLGITDRYIIHPTFFYYSPKTSINVIGDFNNIGKKSFTLNDYINFDGGFSKYLDNPAGFLSLAKSEFLKSLTDNNFVKGEDQFGAFNIMQKISNKVSLNVFSIVNKSKTERKNSNDIWYLLNNQVTNMERREATSISNNFLSMHKIETAYSPSINSDVQYSSTLKTIRGKHNEFQFSKSIFSDNQLSILDRPNAYDWSQNFSYKEKFSRKNTFTCNLDFKKSINDKMRDVNASDSIFPDLISLRGNTPFQLGQIITSKSTDFSFEIKHFWRLNDLNLLYPIVGYNYTLQEYKSEDYQRISEEKNGFTDVGFDNNSIFNLGDIQGGFQYQVKNGKITYNTKMIWHKYKWMVKQNEEIQTHKSKWQLLPEFTLKWDIKNSEKLDFRYIRTSRFTNVSSLANRLRTEQFNKLTKGNFELENDLAHEASLSYYRFKADLGLNFFVSYLYKDYSVQGITQTQGINLINTFIYSNIPDKSVSFRLGAQRTIKKVKLGFSGTTNISDYFRNVNNEKFHFQSINLSAMVKMETKFKNWPNFETGLSQSYSVLESEFEKNNFFRTNPFLEVIYIFFKDFNFNANYSLEYFNNKKNNVKSIFEKLEMSLVYSKEDSPWLFELEGNNLLGVKFVRENSFDQFIIYDQRNFVQPRTIVFKVVYKF